MDWKTLDEMDLMGKRVLTRVDINVPTKNGIVSDTTRIDRIVPTVQHILQAGGTPILIAHFGRPKGKQVPDMSLSVTLHMPAANGQGPRWKRGRDGPQKKRHCSKYRLTLPVVPPEPSRFALHRAQNGYFQSKLPGF